VPERTRSQRTDYGPVDASGPLAAPDLGVAFVTARRLASRGGLAAVLRAAEGGLNQLAAAVAVWELQRRETGRSMDVRLHPRRWRQLSRALERADRYAGGGLGRAGHGVGLVIDLLAELVLRRWEPLPVTSRGGQRRTRELRARNAGTEVDSMAHVICLLDQETRQWRRDVRVDDQAARGGDAA
jgi:hypothetical protein